MLDLRSKNSGYFVADKAKGEIRSRARIDFSAIVGGALAAAFIVAAFSNFIPNTLVSDGTLAAFAAVAGGVIGKLFLV